MSRTPAWAPISRLSAFAGDGSYLNAIIETPKGSRNKFNYDEELGLFTLGSLLPAGAIFPFDFGFIPATLGEDGDPLDVLLLMEEPAFAGCHVPVRLLGAIRAEQTEGDRTIRNDRLIAVPVHSHSHRDVSSLHALSGSLIEEIEHFFVSYNQVRGKVFRPQGCVEPVEAEKLVRASMKRRQQQKHEATAA